MSNVLERLEFAFRRAESLRSDVQEAGATFVLPGPIQPDHKTISGTAKKQKQGDLWDIKIKTGHTEGMAEVEIHKDQTLSQVFNKFREINHVNGLVLEAGTKTKPGPSYLICVEKPDCPANEYYKNHHAYDGSVFDVVHEGAIRVQPAEARPSRKPTVFWTGLP